MCQADDGAKCTDGVAPDGALQSSPEGMPLADIISLKMKEIQEIVGSDPWVTRTPGEASNYIAGYVSGLEEAAKVADYWGSGNWKVKQEKRRRFDLHDLQFHTNSTGRAIAQDIRALLKAAISQSPDEEPRSGDTVRAEDQSASLTHKNNLGTVELSDD
jgi:hypothetical protein